MANSKAFVMLVLMCGSILALIGSAQAWYWKPDLDRDGEITILDVVSVTSYYGYRVGRATWSQATFYDVNRDGRIDILDVVRILNEYATTQVSASVLNSQHRHAPNGPKPT